MEQKVEQQIEALITGHEYIENLYEGVKEAVGYFRSMEIRKGNELTIQIIDGLRWLTEVFSLTKEIQLQEINISGIKGMLREMLEALENEDSVLLADMFEYELLETLEEWYKIIGEVINQER